MKNKILLFITLFSMMLTGCFQKQPMDVLSKAYDELKETKSIEAITNIVAKIEDEDANISLNLPIELSLNASSKKNISLKLSVEDNELVDEFDVYANIKMDVLNVYFPSTLTDFINGTESSEVTWTNFRQKLEIDDEMLEKPEELDIDKIVTEENFVYIDKEGDISHYELTINDELLSRLSIETGQTIEKIGLEVKVDVYINTKTYETTKIVVDMQDVLDTLDLETIEELKLTMEFKKNNSIKVTIPSDIIANSKLFEIDSVIDDANRAAFKTTTYGMLDAIRLKSMENMLEGNASRKTYVFPTTEIEIRGEQPNGVASVDNDGRIAIAVYNEKWCATKGYTDEKITITEYVEGECVISESNNNNDDEKVEEVKLTNADKIIINEELNNSFFYAIDRIINFESSKLTYNTNILNSTKNKYYVTWYTMFNDETLNNSFKEGLTVDGDYETGIYTINKNILKEYYKNMYNETLNESELVNEPYIEISETLLHDFRPVYFSYPFVLKTNKLEKLNDTYTLYVDFLTSFIDESSRNIDYEILELYHDNNIISGYDNFIYAKLKVEYTKNAGNYILKSIKFEKTNSTNDKLDNEVSKTLIEKVGKDEEFGLYYNEKSILAEGHKILGTEIKNNKLYVYLVAKIESLEKADGGFGVLSGMAGPLVIIYNIDNGYQFSEFLCIGLSGGYDINNVFPKHLIKYAKSVNYKDSYYQDQINKYLTN